MKRVNKILILFIFVMSVSFMLTWEFLQSRWVAKKVSDVATKYITEVLNAEVEFENLQFNLFPPGANVKNVSFILKNEKVDLNFKANSLGIYFNPLDVFETDFIADRVVLEDGRVFVELPKSKGESDRDTGSKVDAGKLFDYLPKIPVNTVSLEKILLQVDKTEFFAKEIYLQNKKNSLSFMGAIENIDLSQYIALPIIVDSVRINSILDESRLRVSELEINSGFKKIELNGEVRSYLSDQINYKFNSSLETPIKVLHDIFDFRKVGNLEKGTVKVVSTITGSGRQFSITNQVEAENLVTDFVDADLLRGEILVDNKHIIFQNVIMEKGTSGFQLDSPFEFFNFDSKKFVEEPVVGTFQNFRLSNALKYLKSNVGFLKGSLSAKIRFDLFANSFSFKFLDQALIHELILEANKDLNIFEASDLILQEGDISVTGSDLDLRIAIGKKETQFSILATTRKGKFNLQIPNAFIDLQDISPFMGYNLKGKGLVDIDISPSDKGLVLSVKDDINKFSINEFSFDKVKSELSLNFDSNLLSIEKLFATSGKTNVFARGNIDIGKEEIAASYSVKDASFSEVKRVLAPLLRDVSISTNEIHGNWNLSGNLSGKTSIEGLIVDGHFEGQNNYFYDENVENLNFDYRFEKEKLNVHEFLAQKSGGTIKLKFDYDLAKNGISIWSRVYDIPIQELTWYKRLPLNLTGVLDGEIAAEYLESKWEADSSFRISNTFSNGESFADSNITIKYHLDEIKTDIDLFNQQVLLDSHIVLEEGRTNQSYLNIDLNVPNIRNIAGILSIVELANTDVSGRVRYNLRSEFDSKTWKFNRVQTNMENLVINKKPIFVRYKSTEPEIIIEDGEIKKWDVNIRGKNFYILSKGRGNLYGNFKTNTQSKIDASIIEIFNTVVNKATGNIRANVNFGFQDNEQQYEAYLTSDNLSLASELIPTSITRSEFKISLKDKVFDIEKFYAQLISGTLEVSGEVGLKSLVPDVNLRYKFKDAGVTLFKKSNLVFSGEGSFVGKTFPYTVGGDYYIENFVLVNELTDFASGSGGFVQDEIDYLPGDEEKELDQLINLNLNINTRNPIYVRNSLADLGFTGALQVSGSEKLPRVGGKISLAPRNNKVTFKNNDFVFTKGNIFFNEQNEYSNPELDFAATTSINEYNIYVKVLGPVKTFKVDLTSEPALSQSDILSLIAFGYTEDLSQNLTDSERESMTRAGVTSIIFDSFKINETLKKEFGLEINLGTQISQDQGSLLSGRSGEGSTNTGRVRSATTVELKKKINDAISLSASQTLDTNTQQRKSVNINYNLNKNVSIEGVYETRNTDDLETINVDNSVGADVKLKWSFK